MMNNSMSVSRSAGLRRPSLDPFISVLPDNRKITNDETVRLNGDKNENDNGNTAFFRASSAFAPLHHPLHHRLTERFPNDESVRSSGDEHGGFND